MEWRPNSDKQEKFLSLPDRIFEGLYGGSVGGGKSEVLLNLPVARGFHLEPRFFGIIFRRTKPELEETLIPRSREIFPDTGGRWNSQRSQWEWSNGGILRFSHLEKAEDVYKHKSAEFNYLAFDELTSFLEKQYIYLTTRCRSTTNLPEIVRSGSNPGDVGHLWVRKRFIEHDREGLGNKLIYDEPSETYRCFIRARATDNPAFIKKKGGYYQRLHLLPDAERRALLDGDWWAFSGQVFSEFRSEKLPGEADNALHVIDSFRIPRWCPRILTIDWGYQAATDALWLAVMPKGRIIAYREYNEKEKLTSEWAQEIYDLSRGEKYRDIILCRSAWQQRGEEKQIWEKFQDITGWSPTRASSDRVSGKMLLHEALRWKDKEEVEINENYDSMLAQEILRYEGQKAHDSYMAQFVPVESDGPLPKLQIFKECTELIDTIPICVYNDEKDGKAPEDVKEFNGDDPYDNIRYGLKAIDDGIADENEREIQERKSLDSIHETLEKTQNHTGFALAMARLKQRKRDATRGVPLFGNPRARSRRHRTSWH